MKLVQLYTDGDERRMKLVQLYTDGDEGRMKLVQLYTDGDERRMKLVQLYTYGDEHRTAFVDFHRIAKDNGVSKGKADVDDAWLQVRGTYARSGSVNNVRGVLHTLLNDDCEDMEDEFLSTEKPRDWVALFYYPAPTNEGESTGSATNCQSVLDRVKRAMVLGASAIIILVLNPKVIKEVNLSPMTSIPVVLVQDPENVTAVLQAIVSKLKMSVHITYKAYFFDLQVTLWSMCGRSTPGSGVICPSHSAGLLSKANPSHFWNYFISMVVTSMLLLLIMKTEAGEDADGERDENESFRRIASQALAAMKVKRYRRHLQAHNFDDSERDTCAVCLDAFHPKQKIRVLPCLHEYHVKCVDTWLITHHTCPLCKLNIVDERVRSGMPRLE
ncbi:RING-type domain-containing protein [Lamellibrachia satsuma]|nr:RING-type domain-containing protein [Lamellibrachia satsuma]